MGPIFATNTKKDAAKPIGIEGLRQVRQATKIPIFAIGGITPANASRAIEAGADGVCAISAASGDNVKNKVRAFSRLFARSQKPNPI